MIDRTSKKIFRTGALVVAALAILPLSPAMASTPIALAGTAALEKIRVADHERYQRVVIDTSDAVTFSVVEGESALTLTLSGIISELQTKAWTDLGQVKGLRIEPVSDTSILIIFDLAGPMHPRISSYTPDSYGGHRIVIDLWPAEETPGSSPVSDHEPRPEPQPESDPASDIIKTAELPKSDPDEEHALQEINQWPVTLDEAAQTIVEKEAAALILGQPTLDDGAPIESDETPDLSGSMGGDMSDIMNGMITADPVASARERMTQGSPGEACKVLQVNFPKGTWNIDAMLLQGECLRALGNLTDANTLYTEVLSYEPDSIAARLGLAHIQVENGDLTAARDNYTRALAKLPSGDLADDTRLRLQNVEEQLKHAVH